MISPSDEIRDDDFSEENRLKVDELGTHKQFQNMGIDLYDVTIELMQNAFDSKNRGEHNTIELIVPRDPKPNEVVLTCIDHGDAITRDYDNDLQKFIAAQRATSEKTKRTGTIGNKGIGMFQYTRIGKRIIITSMDKNKTTGKPELIYRLPMYLADSGYTAFGRPLVKPAIDEYQKELGLNHIGTKVTFFDRDPDSEPIDEKKLIKVLKEQYTVLLAANPNVTVFLNGKVLELPKWITKHPPHLIARMSGARNPTEHDYYNIMGAIWKDEKGSGEIRIYKDGNFVESYVFDPRQCAGYINVNAVNTTTDRGALLRDKRFKELAEKMLKEVSRFPKLEDDKTDQGLTKNLTDLAKRALSELLPKSPMLQGDNKQKKKIETNGRKSKNPADDIGHEVGKAPDPNRIVQHRIFKGRDPTNRGRVICDPNSTTKIKKESDNKDNRNEIQELVEKRGHFGDKPYIRLFLDRAPGEMLVNKDNGEHVVMAQSKNYETKVNLLDAQLAEIIAGVDEETRMKQSNARIAVLKSMGRYPKVTVQAKAGKNTNAKQGSNWDE